MTQPTRTPITREGVEAAYRFLLGRPPESEKAYDYGLSAGSVETLRRWLINSEEFVHRLRQEQPRAVREWVRAEARRASRPPAMPAPRPRIVFLHIMKTAGTSVTARLESLCTDMEVWRHRPDGPAGDATLERLASFGLFVGHMKLRDALAVPSPRRIFTVLREPRDRLVSLYHFMHRHRADYIREDRQGMRFEATRIARDATLEEFLACPAQSVRNQVVNGMTRALAGGDIVPVGPGRYRDRAAPDQAAISGAELLHRALGTLLALDFVAFVDRLEEDRPALMQALGLPDPGPWPRENTQATVNDTIEPRPAPVVTPAAARALEELNDLDLMLYRLARQHRGV